MATLLEPVCRNLFIFILFFEIWRSRVIYFLPKNSFVCVKIVFFRVKRMQPKKKKKRWSTSSRVYIPFNSFLSWKKKAKKKKKMRITNLYTPSTFHSIPFLSFFRKKKKKIENHSSPSPGACSLKKHGRIRFFSCALILTTIFCVFWHYYLQIF